MNFEIKNISPTIFEISGRFREEEIKELYQSELERLAKSAKIPGFRPGKAPIEIIERKYGEEAKNNAVKSKIAEIIEQETKKKDKWIETLSFETPVWSQKGDTIEFSIKVEVIPKKKIELDVDIEKPQEKLDVSDDEVKREIENLKERFAVLEEETEKDMVSQDDVAVFDIIIKNIKTGKITQKRISQIVNIQNSEEFFKKLVDGMKINEVREAVLGDEKVTVILKGIKRKVIPKEEDLAKTLGYNDEKEMYEDIKKRILNQKKNELKSSLYFSFIGKVAEKNQLSIPRTLFMQKLNEVISRYPQIERKLAESQAILLSAEEIVIKNIIEQDKIDISDEDIENYIQELSERTSIPPQKVKENFKDRMETLKALVKEKKVQEKIFEIIEKKIS